MLVIQLDEWLERRGKSLYWLAKEVGAHYNTLWRIQKGKAEGIRFELLEGICRALDCKPGDILTLAEHDRAERRLTQRKGRPAL